MPQNAIVAYALYNISAAIDPSDGNKARVEREEMVKELSSREIEAGQALTRRMMDPRIGLLAAIDRELVQARPNAVKAS